MENAQSAAKDYSTDIAANKTAIADEATARTDADTQLDTRITNVKEYLENQTAANYVSKSDAAVQDGAVAKAGNTIGENVTNLDGALAKETAARIGADAAQDKVIKQVNDNLVSSVNTINKNVADGFNALSAADQTLQKNIDAEATARTDADTQLDTRITNVKEYLENQTAANYVSKSDAAVQDGAVVKADKTIGENVTNLDGALAKETAARIGADAAQDKVIKQVNDNLVSSVNTINKNVADGFNALSAVDLQEAQTRAAADQTLQNQIANNAQAIGTTKDGNYVKSNNSVGQNLNALDAQVGQNSANINQLFSDYSSMKTDINKVGARSAALAGLHPLDFDPANKLNFAIASGSFKGENSVALGAFYRPNENVMFSAASTMGDSDNAYTFGLSFKIGPSSAKTKTTSPDAEELYKVVGQLQDQLAAQQKEIEQLKAEKTAK